ncbi:hypothetical protein [Arsenicicoccus sp. oral taxon 190]|uniref:hypothetical protein n=1 Tax=Arsenicicoccus sp. oral taxon 190 TaxID=1658671 RepID=UPI000679F35D|nr:hypothetical protein [Arsenicicoccus sp. oral taxon 190]AKT50196.1 hypothetical protein ADJ73_00590 [Arsenicicoccus sp. oral taxon 190]
MATIEQARRGFLAQLLEAGHYVPLGRPGVWGRSAAFEQVLMGLVGALDGFYAERPQTVVHFGPVVPQALLERTGYVTTQPHLVGSIDAFSGDDADHREIVADLEEGRDWATRLQPSGLVMVSSACHPLYGALAHQRVQGSYQIFGWVFRHEPSEDPFRTASFRQKESVHVGDHDACQEHRDHWVGRAEELLLELGLPVEQEVANDPFFGRAGRMMARGQRQAALKKELTIGAYPGHPRTALASGNLHGDHFTAAFDITLPDGSPAETSCMGFGLERTTLSLLRVHGMDVGSWPAGVRQRLGLQAV